MPGPNVAPRALLFDCDGCELGSSVEIDREAIGSQGRFDFRGLDRSFDAGIVNPCFARQVKDRANLSPELSHLWRRYHHNGPGIHRMGDRVGGKNALLDQGPYNAACGSKDLGHLSDRVHVLGFMKQAADFAGVEEKRGDASSVLSSPDVAKFPR